MHTSLKQIRPYFVLSHWMHYRAINRCMRQPQPPRMLKCILAFRLTDCLRAWDHTCSQHGLASQVLCDSLLVDKQATTTASIKFQYLQFATHRLLKTCHSNKYTSFLLLASKTSPTNALLLESTLYIHHMLRPQMPLFLHQVVRKWAVGYGKSFISGDAYFLPLYSWL